MIFAMNITTGRQLWTFKSVKPALPVNHLPATVWQNALFVWVARRTDGLQLLRVDATTGKGAYYSQPVSGALYLPYLVAQPAAGDGNIYQLVNLRYLGAYDIRDGQLRWVAPIQNGLELYSNDGVAAAGGEVYFSCQAKALCAYDSRTGHRDWVFKSVDNLGGPMAVGSGKVVFISGYPDLIPHCAIACMSRMPELGACGGIKTASSNTHQWR